MPYSSLPYQTLYAPLHVDIIIQRSPSGLQLSEVLLVYQTAPLPTHVTTHTRTQTHVPTTTSTSVLYRRLMQRQRPRKRNKHTKKTPCRDVHPHRFFFFCTLIRFLFCPPFTDFHLSSPLTALLDLTRSLCLYLYIQHCVYIYL